jgi:hypothetical protein
MEEDLEDDRREDNIEKKERKEQFKDLLASVQLRRVLLRKKVTDFCDWLRFLCFSTKKSLLGTKRRKLSPFFVNKL